MFNKKQVILLPADAPASLKAKAPIKTLFDGTQIYVNNQVQIGDMDEVLRIARENGQIVKKVWQQVLLTIKMHSLRIFI